MTYEDASELVKHPVLWSIDSLQVLGWSATSHVVSCLVFLSLSSPFSLSFVASPTPSRELLSLRSLSLSLLNFFLSVHIPSYTTITNERCRRRRH